MDRRSLLSGGGVLLAAQLLPTASRRPRQDLDRSRRKTPIHADGHRSGEGSDYPFGAVIVRDGRVLAFGRNSTKRNSDPTAHAEMVAIRAFLNGHEPDDLKDGDALQLRRAVRDVHGRDHLVRDQAAGVRGLDRRSCRHASARSTSRRRQIATAAPFSKIEIAGGLLSRRSDAPVPGARNSGER